MKGCHKNDNFFVLKYEESKIKFDNALPVK